MFFIDIHCHIDSYGDVKEIVRKAKEKGVGIIVNNGVDVKSNRETLKLAKKFPEIKAALGLYPIDALNLSDKEIEKELEFIGENKDKIFAVGEVGIDLKESKELERQAQIFEEIIKLAIRIDKPLIVHSRKAEEECVKTLERLKAKKVIMHCFSGNMSLVKKIVSNGWSLSIPANAKYSEHFQNIIKLVSLDNLFCETDSPYLHPDKEENNTPENVLESYKKIAEINGMTIDEVKERVWDNYLRMK